jgi:hypothetical protein
MSLTNSPWPGIIKFFPAREGLVSDIPAGDGELANLFFTVYTLCDEDIAHITYTVIDGIDGVCWYVCMYLYDKSFLNWTSRVGGEAGGRHSVDCPHCICLYICRDK